MNGNEYSESFAMGTGTLEHNLRIKKGKGLRQNGVLERRHLNEYLVVDKDLLKDPKTYTQKLIEKVVGEEIGDRLREANERNIRNRHYDKVRTLSEWIDAQRYMKNNKEHSIVSEYLVALGDKYTGCPYEIQLDGDGNMIDTHGNVIRPWDTRHKPAYKDGIITESRISKKFKQACKKFLVAFKKKNPRARVISAAVHCDEGGGVHMHINVIWVASVQRDVGISLSKTTAMEQQYAEQGIVCKNTKKVNAQSMWRADMYQLWIDVCRECGIERRDMHNKNKHISKKEYYGFADRRSEAFENRDRELNEREASLDKKEKQVLEKENRITNQQEALCRRQERVEKMEHDISVKQDELNAIRTKMNETVKTAQVLIRRANETIELGANGLKRYIVNEWRILRNNHPDWFAVVHEENIKQHQKKTNVLDKQTRVR